MDKLLQNCNKYDIMHLAAIARDYFSKNRISDDNVQYASRKVISPYGENTRALRPVCKHPDLRAG